MTAQQINTSSPNNGRGILGDRTARLGILALIAAVIVLTVLVGFITLYPIQTINTSISNQANEELMSFGGTLARQTESYFNTLADDLLGLASRPAIQAEGTDSHDESIRLMADEAKIRFSDIASIVRVDADGKPLYGWPNAYDQKIAAGKPLPWTVDKKWVDSVVSQTTASLSRRSNGDGVTFLLAAPVAVSGTKSGALIFEIYLTDYFEQNVSPVKIGDSGQIWAFDQTGGEVFRKAPVPEFVGGTGQFLSTTEITFTPDYPSEDRNSVIVPIYTAFSQARNRTGLFILILSRAKTEGQESVTTTLRSLFFIGLAGIAIIVVIGLVIGISLIRASNRRRQDEQRRSTARVLLEVSRALNSSLDVNVVLQKILGELGRLLPHDSASVLLLDEERENVSTAAETGKFTPDHQRTTMPLTAVRAAREVLVSGKPVVINNTMTDPRWNLVKGSNIRSWLGVPLRVRDESVGVLNINSYEMERFGLDDIDLAEAFADQAGAAIQNARSHELQIRVYEAELETAQAIQISLLPQEAPPIPQLQVAARSIPARHVSGDYYQYFPLPDGKLGFAVGDVSGKGIPAALLMAVITTALRDEILRVPAPAALLNELNKRLLPRMQQTKMNSALLVCVFDPITRHVEMANGGMVQPYVRTTKGWEFVPVGGYPLGASARTSYSAKTVTLAPESTMIFITDGIVEAQNKAGELYGFERLEALLNGMPISSTSEQLADAILGAVREFLSGEEAQDDITIVVVKSLEVERVEVNHV